MIYIFKKCIKYIIHKKYPVFEMNHIFRQPMQALVQTIFTQYVNKQKRKRESKAF